MQAQLDYEPRGLLVCQCCGNKYNISDRTPRILLNCGHTLCTICVSLQLTNKKVRCSICSKSFNSPNNIEKLPLNLSMLYEIIMNDPVLSKISFENTADDSHYCKEHGQKEMHFYCSHHNELLCRDCIKEKHKDDDCYLIELYEIIKIRKMVSDNNIQNDKQAKKEATQK